ncbi:MAG: DUF2117 domain-containing protein [Methanoregula sp.]|nr:MAG: DUF2117 domain-containing protein [Methanoregula sp.]
MTAQPVMVVHGPEIFDCGEVGWLIDTISPMRTIVAGVMARTAAEESGLPVEFQGDPPSLIINRLPDPVFLANHGKTAESGQIFGDIIASRLPGRGLVHVECSSRTVYIWDAGDKALASALSHLTGFTFKEAASTYCMVPGERVIRGCIPGEPVYINGIIIGRATLGTVILRNSDNFGIEPVIGLAPKVHGIRKVVRQGRVDLAAAWCKSGSIRTALPHEGARAVRAGRVVVIDHCGHQIYQKIGTDCCGVLSIGDDTTAVCGHICAHRGIPVLGIVDGDRDTIVTEAFPRGSVVVHAVSERDDDIGSELVPMAEKHPVVWDEWVDLVLEMLGDRVRVVVDTRVKRNAVR